MKKKGNVKVIIFYIALIAIIFVAMFAMLGTPTNQEEVLFSDIMNYFEEDRVNEFEVTNENIITLVVYKTDKVGIVTPEDVVGAPTEKVSYKLRDVSIFIDAFENDIIHFLQKFNFENTPIMSLMYNNTKLCTIFVHHIKLGISSKVNTKSPN